MMVWGSNFKHSSVRLEETIYIKYLYYKKINTMEYKHLKTGSSMISWRASDVHSESMMLYKQSQGQLL